MGYVYLQILMLRVVHEQLLHLLSKQEHQELHVDEAFTPFADLNPLHYNPFTQGLWEQAVNRYNAAMSAAEQRIASKLRHQFRGLETNSQQVYRWAQLCISRFFQKCWIVSFVINVDVFFLSSTYPSSKSVVMQIKSADLTGNTELVM